MRLERLHLVIYMSFLTVLAIPVEDVRASGNNTSQTTNSTGCTKFAIGLEDINRIHGNRFSASSEYNRNYRVENGRLNGEWAWAPHHSDQNSYLQIDLDQVYVICAVATQGSGRYNEWVTSYKVQLSMDNLAWVAYKEKSADKVFSGNKDRATAVSHVLSTSTMARFVRFLPLTSAGGKAMRVEVYGARPRVCKSSFGLMDNTIPDSSFTASSNSVNASAGRLYGGSSWCSATSSSFEYLQVDLGQVKSVTGIATQGDATADKWVKTYLVKYSIEGLQWTTYTGATKEAMVLNGNSNKHLVVINWLSHPIKARYIRVNPRSWNGGICLRVDLYGDYECSCENIPLGVEDWRIPDSRITASTNGASAAQARLGDSNSSWCASPSDVTPYLQVDLGSPHVICAVATQGNPTADQWVMTYRIQISSNGVNWTSYSETNKPSRMFCGNYDRSSTVHQLLYKSPMARYVRVLPVNFTGSRCLRVELYGSRINPDCATHSVGVPSGVMVPNYRFKASSRILSQPWHGRLTWSKNWQPGFDSNPYLQVDLGAVYRLCTVSTQGSTLSMFDWVTRYRIMYSLDNLAWTDYKENGVTRVFGGNSNDYSIVTNRFNSPFQAKFVRIYVVSRRWLMAALRIDYSGLTTGCKTSLGMEKHIITDAQLSVSSNSDGSHQAKHGRLYGGSSWCSATAANTEYLQVDLGQVKTVTGIATQGNPAVDKWVTRYTIKYGFYTSDWYDAKEGLPSVKVFVGNTNSNSVRHHWFFFPFDARFVRVFPRSWHAHICTRIDLYGCLSHTPRIKDKREVILSRRDASVFLPCVKNENPQGVVYMWYKNGIHIAGNASNKLEVKYKSAEETMQTYSCKRTSGQTIICSMRYTCIARHTPPRTGVMHASSITLLVQLVAPTPSSPPTVDPTHRTRNYTSTPKVVYPTTNISNIWETPTDDASAGSKGLSEPVIIVLIVVPIVIAVSLVSAFYIWWGYKKYQAQRQVEVQAPAESSETSLGEENIYCEII